MYALTKLTGNVSLNTGSSFPFSSKYTVILYIPLEQHIGETGPSIVFLLRLDTRDSGIIIIQFTPSKRRRSD